METEEKPESGMSEVMPQPKAKVATGAFLRDVFTCSLGAYGGPEAHMSVFLDQMVVRKKYLTENELVELIALCSILPGPTSTQTIVSIGYKMGGPRLALLTMLVWATPAIMAMTLLSFLYAFLVAADFSTDVLRYVGPMAVGFILVATWRIGRKVVTDIPTGLLMISGAVVTWFIRAPWIFPLVLVAGGFTSILLAPEKNLWNRVKIRPPWHYLAVFSAFALGGLALAAWSDFHMAGLFEHFYRYGYLVFGGGQVVVPVMHGELVESMHAMTTQEFLTGYGLVQGLPGPMFSFAAYAGGMAARGVSIPYQVLGGLIGGVGIFLPGLLLIYFVYPVWETLKGIRAVKVSLRGINAVAGGLIAVAGVILLQAGGLRWDFLAVTVLTALLLFSRKVPAPLIVAATLTAGVF